MDKKPFKPVFNNPLKRSGVPTEREGGEWTQVQIMEKAVAPIQTKKPKIKKTATDNSRKLQKNLKKKDNNDDRMKLPMSSLTDTEYDEIFSLAINRAMTGGISSSIMQHDTGNSDMEDEIETRAAIPEANEALSPQEAAAGPMEVQAKQTFSKKKIAAPGASATDCMTGITPAEDSFKAKKQNAEHVRGAARKSKVPLSTGTPNPPSLPVRPKKQETQKVQDKMQKRDQECKKHSNAYQNFKPVCKDTDSLPKFKKMRQNQASKHQDNSSSQKSALAERNEPAVKDSSQLSQSGYLQNHSGSHSKHSTQCSHHSQKCGHVCNNKHGHNHSNAVQDSKIHQRSVTHKSASQSQCSQAFLSQPGPDLSPKERLLWLQKRREVGLWVQCCRPTCNKWRYLHDIHDPLEVPEQWFCHMNSDKRYNSCAAPEKPPTPLEEEDLIHNIYTAGSVVWGRLAGYPWWPAMVDDDPDTEQYYWINSFSDIPTHYNVVFFDEKDVTRAWLTPGAMRPFTGYENSKEFRTTIARGTDYAKRLQVAKLQAQKALPMGIGERLRTFGFLARYKGPIGSIKRKKEQDKRKTAEDEETISLNSDNDETLSVYRNLREDGGKEKPKKKRAKSDRTTKRTTKKTKVQAADNEETAVMSETIDNVSKINNNKVPEHDASSRPNQTTFSSSLYTQELSNKETDDPNKELIPETSSVTNPENVSAPDSTWPSKNHEEKEITDGTNITSHDSETQLSITAEQDETIINCSQDLFPSQTAATQQNTSQKNKAHTGTGIRTDIGLHKSSTSSGAIGRNANANHEENKTSEVTADSCMATVGENNRTEQIQNVDSTNRVLDILADNITAKDGAANDEDNHESVTEVESSASVLQPDIHKPSTSNVHTDSHLNCSDSMPLVPDIQHDNFQTKANQHCDAVVPQLDYDNFDDNSCDSLDFEPEE